MPLPTFTPRLRKGRGRSRALEAFLSPSTLPKARGGPGRGSFRFCLAHSLCGLQSPRYNPAPGAFRQHRMNQLPPQTPSKSCCRPQWTASCRSVPSCRPSSLGVVLLTGSLVTADSSGFDPLLFKPAGRAARGRVHRYGAGWFPSATGAAQHPHADAGRAASGARWLRRG